MTNRSINTRIDACCMPSCQNEIEQGVMRLLNCPQDNIVVSGDKKGQVAVWDFERVHERTVYGHMHRALTNHIRFMGPLHDTRCASAASDGLLKVWHTT